MFRGHLMPTSDDPTLEKAKCGFNTVRGNVAVHVDLGGVIDGLVYLPPLPSEINRTRIGWEIISHNYFNILAHMLLDVLSQRSLLRIFCVEEPQFTVPLLNANDNLRSEERRVGKECRSRWS